MVLENGIERARGPEPVVLGRNPREEGGIACRELLLEDDG